MGRRSESKRSGALNSLDEGVCEETCSRLAELGRRFERFREQHGPRARVSEELRAEVFEALREGVAVTGLRRECGLTRSQIAGWEATRERVSERVRRSTPKVRAFSVVEDEPCASATPEAVAEQALELRVGPWAVSVRLAGLTPARRG